MKRFLNLLIFALLASSFSINAQTAQPERQGLPGPVLRDREGEFKFLPIGVAFYNLENLFDTINNNDKYDLEFSPNGARQWDGRKYWSKIHNMAYAISQLATERTPYGPAVLGVSEIENITVLQDLVKDEQIAKWNLQIVHHDSPDRRGVDVGFLYNPRFFKVLNVTHHRLSIEGEPEFLTRDQTCMTGLLCGEKVSLIVNHWPSRLGGEELSSYKREAAAALCKQIADSLWKEDPNQAIIIMGDLNDDPHNSSCSKVLGAVRYKEEAVKNGFYNPFWNKLEKEGIGSLAYKGQWNLFDQIIISGNLVRDVREAEHIESPNLVYTRCEVWNRDFLKGHEGSRVGYPLRTFSGGVFLNGYSDHFPTQIFLVKKVRPRDKQEVPAAVPAN